MSQCHCYDCQNIHNGVQLNGDVPASIRIGSDGCDANSHILRRAEKFVTSCSALLDRPFLRVCLRKERFSSQAFSFGVVLGDRITRCRRDRIGLASTQLLAKK